MVHSISIVLRKGVLKQKLLSAAPELCGVHSTAFGSRSTLEGQPEDLLSAGAIGNTTVSSFPVCNK
jgi:hypothetical protein